MLNSLQNLTKPLVSQNLTTRPLYTKTFFLLYKNLSILFSVGNYSPSPIPITPSPIPFHFLFPYSPRLSWTIHLAFPVQTNIQPVHSKNIYSVLVGITPHHCHLHLVVYHLHLLLSLMALVTAVVQHLLDQLVPM
jgi:hypothetical protein